MYSSGYPPELHDQYTHLPPISFGLVSSFVVARKGSVRIFPLSFPAVLTSPLKDSKANQNQASHGMQLAANPHDPTMEMTKTPAERAREKSLLNDPLAIVLGPSCVECKQCKKKIKLSSKSAYDTFHWRNHRARCLRTLKKMKKKGIPLRQPVSTPLKAATTSKPPPQNVEPRKSQTPPLIDISDSEEDQSSAKSPEAQSPAAPSSPHSVQTSADFRHPELASILDDYIIRSHPECTQRTRLLSDHWQSWSWSQLKEPRFEPPAYNGDDDDDEHDDEFGYHRSISRYSPHPRPIDADLRDHEAAHALSMLSRSH